MNVEGTKKTRRLTLFSSLFPSAVDWFLPRGRIKAKQTEARVKPAAPKTSSVKRVVKVGLLQRGGGRSDVNSESGSAHLLFPFPGASRSLDKKPNNAGSSARWRSQSKALTNALKHSRELGRFPTRRRWTRPQG